MCILHTCISHLSTCMHNTKKLGNCEDHPSEVTPLHVYPPRWIGSTLYKWLLLQPYYPLCIFFYLSMTLPLHVESALIVSTWNWFKSVPIHFKVCIQSGSCNCTCTCSWYDKTIGIICTIQSTTSNLLFSRTTLWNSIYNGWLGWLRLLKLLHWWLLQSGKLAGSTL